jgi:diadenosine tetraphosphate (Ap4A) HIT family hydrolase
VSLDRLWAGWRQAFVSGERADDHAGGSTAAEVADAVRAAGGDPDCVFCRIAFGGLPDSETNVVWRDPEGWAVAVLNAYPYTSGHLMVMPTRHVGELEDLDVNEALSLMTGLRQAIVALKAAYSPGGLNLGVNLGRAAGAGVPAHVHVHVLPRWQGDTNFMTSVADARVLPEAISASADRLRAAWPR